MRRSTPRPGRFSKAMALGRILGHPKELLKTPVLPVIQMATTAVLQQGPPLARVAPTSSTEDVWPNLPQVTFLRQSAHLHSPPRGTMQCPCLASLL
eukprot:7425837-Prorocentrum_lima.AAC.1